MKVFTHTCYHCRTGMIFRLPSRCPECEKWLTVEIKAPPPRPKKDEKGAITDGVS